jgi:hypothetical protein
VSILSDIEARRIRHETVTQLLAMLAATGTPSQIGARCLLLAYAKGALVSDDLRPLRQRDLARRLDVSEQRVSAAIKLMRQKLEQIQANGDSQC